MRNDRLGYMCTCPTNLGTVVRCSAHIQLKVSYQRCFETPEVGIIVIFVLFKYENELELVGSDISFNSVRS